LSLWIVKVLVLSQTSAVSDYHFHTMVQRSPQQEWITKFLIFLCFDCLLLAAMAKQRQIEFAAFFIKLIAQLIGRIQPHRVRQPFDQPRTAPSHMGELSKSIAAIRMD